jgi:hypothetical protein
MSVTAITSLNPKIKNIDSKKGKYSCNYTFRWAGLTPDPTVVVPGFIEASGLSILGTGISDIFAPLLKANAAANIPPIKWVMGTVVMLPQNVASGSAQGESAGGLYLVSPDTGQVISLEQDFNAYRVYAGITNIYVSGLVNPGSISFSLPFETVSESSIIQVIKLQDVSGAGNAMNGFANLVFLTYESQVYLRGC